MNKIEWIENKSKDWKVATVIDPTTSAQYENVSINRTGKNGEVFPNFDGIMAGSMVEGNLWTSSAGKHYLFPPKLQGQYPTKTKPPFKEMMKEKLDGIKLSQDRKEEGIKHSSVMRMSHEIALAEIQHLKEGPDGEIVNFDSNFKPIFEKWHKFYADRWESPF